MSPGLSFLFAQHLRPDSPPGLCASVAAMRGWIEAALQPAGAGHRAGHPRLALQPSLSAGCGLFPAEIPLAGSKGSAWAVFSSHSPSSDPYPDLTFP